MKELDSVREAARKCTTLPQERIEDILSTYFRSVPLRTQYALAKFPLETSAVLDVGCGPGTSLAHFGRGSMGIDNNADAVEFCNAVGLEARLVDVDHPFDLGQRQFEYLWVSDILEHLEAPRLVLRQLMTALKPSGKLLLQTSALPSPLARRVLRAQRKQPFDADVHYHQWTRQTMSHLLARAGYRVERVLVPHPPSLAGVSLLLRPAVAPRLVFVAAPDAVLLRTVERSEARNRRIA